MAGERVLLVESSAAVQDMTKATLEEHGFRVTVAHNGVAALNHPDIEKFTLVIIDSGLDGLDGLETTRFIKTDNETHQVPVLLLVPDDQMDARSSQPLQGASAWLAKPFTPQQILAKAKQAIQEQKLKLEVDKFLEESAEKHMQELAELKIQRAVERKIQIIVERAIQSIVSIIDQRAKREVDQRVTALVEEKEQSLVKLTVQEVARSQIEKLAERKVTEAMEQILVAQTEKTVKRAVDSILPSMIRERLRESIENTLPREIQARVEKAAVDKAQEIAEGIQTVLQSQAQKIVPLVAKEKLPEIAERAVIGASETKIPQLVQAEARAAVANEIATRLRPIIDDNFNQLRRRTNMMVLLGLLAMVAVLIFTILVPVFQDVIRDVVGIESTVPHSSPQTPTQPAPTTTQ